MVEMAPGLIVTAAGVVVPDSKTSLLILKFCSRVVTSAAVPTSFQAKMTLVPAPGELDAAPVPSLFKDQLSRAAFQVASVVPRQ